MKRPDRPIAQKGSALVSGLFLSLLIAGIAFTVLSFASTRQAYSVNAGIEVRNFWLAVAGINRATEAVSLSADPGTGEVSIETLGPWKYEYGFSDRNGWELEVRTLTGTMDRTWREPLDFLSYADPLLILGADTALAVPERTSAVLNGPLLVDGALSLAVDGKLTVHSLRLGVRPLSCRTLVIQDSTAKSGEIICTVQDRFRTVSRYWLLKDGEKNSEGIFPAITELSGRLGLVSLADLLAVLRSDPRCVVVDPAEWKIRTRLVNPRLLEKDLLAVYSGGDEVFNLPEDRVPKNVYFVLAPSTSSSTRLDPWRTADTSGYPGDFSVSRHQLVCTRQPRTLALNPADCSMLNRFDYGRPPMIAASLARNVGTVFIDGKRLVEGRDGEIDRENRRLVLYSPDFVKSFGRGDGLTREFPRPPGFEPGSILFSGRQRATGYRVEKSSVVFDSAPEQGRVLSWYTRLPVLTVVKEALEPGTAVFLDKLVEPLKIDLSDLRYPDGTVLVFDAPLIVSGKTSRKLVLATASDVYLHDTSASGGLKIFCRLLWNAMPAGRQLVLENVYLFSEGSEIYDLDGPAPGISISGSLTLTCRFGTFSGRLTPASLVEGSDDLLRLDLKPSDRLDRTHVPFFMLHPDRGDYAKN